MLQQGFWGHNWSILGGGALHFAGACYWGCLHGQSWGTGCFTSSGGSPQVLACPVLSCTHCDHPHCRETPQNSQNRGSPRPRRCWHSPSDTLGPNPSLQNLQCPSSPILMGGTPLWGTWIPSGDTKPAVPTPPGPNPKVFSRVLAAWAQPGHSGCPTLTLSQDISQPLPAMGILLFISKQ